MNTAIELGLIYAIMAIGVYLTFRILDFPDLTVDGSFTTGGATAAVLIVNDVHFLLAMAAAFAVGTVAGLVTGLLHTKGNINGLLAGILTMIALYSINLRIMGKANVPLLGEDTAFSFMRSLGASSGSWALIAILLVLILLLKLIVDWFLSTDLGLSLQATGDNEEMIRSFGVSTDRMKILGLMLSNGLVALCGAVVAQQQGFADISMGIGLILVGLASVIVGQALLGTRTVFMATLAVIVGAVIYRLAIYFALTAGLNANDMKLISAILVVAALLLPQAKIFRRIGGLRRDRGAVSDIAADGAQGSPALATSAAAPSASPAADVPRPGSSQEADRA